MAKSKRVADIAYKARRKADGFSQKIHWEHYTIHDEVVRFIDLRNIQALEGEQVEANDLQRFPVWAHRSVIPKLLKWLARENKKAIKVD